VQSARDLLGNADDVPAGVVSDRLGSAVGDPTNILRFAGLQPRLKLMLRHVHDVVKVFNDRGLVVAPSCDA
jgi:hypothetical protein